MSKSDEQRFDAAVKTLLSIAQHEGMVFYKGYAGVLEWLDQQTDRVSAKRKAGAALSLGYHFSSSPAIAAFRDAIRALLLVQVTRFALSGTPLKRIKERASANPMVARAKVIQELKALCELINVRPGGILIDERVHHWAAVSRFANMGRTLRAGRDTGVQLLESAYAHVAGGNDPDGHYRRWFGSADASVVLKNLKDLMDAYRTKTIGIYVEESEGQLSAVFGSAQRTFDALSTAKVIKVNLGAHFYSRSATHSHQIVYDEQQISYMESILALSEERGQLRSRFIQAIKVEGSDPDVLEREMEASRDVLKTQMELQYELLPKGPEQISVAGVILHEVSHSGIGTTDVKEAGQTMYGPNYCKWLARTNPAKTLINADSYRLFCEQFMAPRAN
jgi:hypothetical protein